MMTVNELLDHLAEAAMTGCGSYQTNVTGTWVMEGSPDEDEKPEFVVSVHHV